MKFKEKDYHHIFVKILKIKNTIKNKLYKKETNIFLNNFNNWDSMTHVAILTSIEKNFDIKVNHTNIKFFNNYISGLNYLKKIKKK